MSSEGRLLMTDNTTLAPTLFARRYSFDSRSRVVVVSLCCALNLTSTEDELLKALSQSRTNPSILSTMRCILGLHYRSNIVCRHAVSDGKRSTSNRRQVIARIRVPLTI